MIILLMKDILEVGSLGVMSLKELLFVELRVDLIMKV